MKKKYILLPALLVCCFFANAQKAPGAEKSKQATAFPSGEAYQKTRITFKLIPATNNGWCYDVYVDGKLMIHQPSKPGLPGNDGFKTKAAATKVAQLVVSKMKNGEMPPSVTVEEMRKLKVLE